MYGSYKLWSRLQMCLFCRFSIDRHTDLERQFNINADDGKITLATPLDRELSVWHNITIIATEISKCLGLFISSLCACVQFMPRDHTRSGPVSFRYFGIRTSVSKETWNASSQHEITYAVVNYQKVAIYVGRKHFYIQVFLYLYTHYSAIKNNVLHIKIWERFSIKG